MRQLKFVALCLPIAFLVLVAGVTLIAVGVTTVVVEDGTDNEVDNLATTKPAVTAQAAGGDNSVAVTLRDFAIILGAESGKAGEITFNITNAGPDLIHEFVIIQTDLAPDALPTEDEGFVDEAGAEIQVYDALEDIQVGDTQSLTTNLEAGNYVMICNIFHQPENVSHYTQGMRAAFTVE